MPNPIKDDAYTPTRGNKTPWDTIRNSFGGAYNATVNAFKDLGKMLGQTPEVKAMNEGLKDIPVGGTPSPFQPPQFYQVKDTDKGMDDIAQRYGLPLDQVVDLNRSKTLPPKGSYIQLINQGVPASVASQIAGGGYQPATTSTRPMGRGNESYHRLYVQAQQIKNQILAGQDPLQIPSAVVGLIKKADGTPLTIQDLIKEGYTMNDQGILVKSGTPAQPQSDNNWQTNPALNIVTWNRNAKNKKNTFKTTEKWARNAMRRKMGKGKNKPAQPAQPAAPSTREGPQTILDLHLGSG
jgi:hypothetical protein